jgi:RNA polymerase sigma-70 factor, ECF subfamily
MVSDTPPPTIQALQVSRARGSASLRGYEDASLVLSAQAGDADAFGALVDRHHHRVYGIVYRMCGPSDADDISQDVFVRALTALHGFRCRDDAGFRIWLYRITINTCINELRRRKRW